MKLEADSAWRQVNFFRGAGHAGRVHDCEEQFELVDIHRPAPTGALAERWRLARKTKVSVSRPPANAMHSTPRTSACGKMQPRILPTYGEDRCSLALAGRTYFVAGMGDPLGRGSYDGAGGQNRTGYARLFR